MSESLSRKREVFQDNAIRKKGSLLLTNSQKGKFIIDSSQGFLPQPTQWLRVRKSLEQRLLPKFIRYAQAVSSWLKRIGYMFAKQFYWYKLSWAFFQTWAFTGFSALPLFFTGRILIGWFQVT